MEKKNRIAIGLMCSSMLLLLLLQFFWLRGAYDDAADDFRKETNTLFRNTIFMMHDSVIQRSLLPIGADSIWSKMVVKKKGPHFDENIAVKEMLPDSISKYVTVTEKAARIEIFTTEKGDSITRMIRPLVARMRTTKEPRSFVFRLASDSLNEDSIRINFGNALAKAGIDADYEIIRVRGPRFHPPEIASPTHRFVSDIVPFSPMSHYAVSFAGAPSLIWKEITPQLLFGIFLTLLTAVSFIALYRNLRAQQRLMEIKNDFISNVTHELKTPVATVSVALEALKNFNALDNPQRTKEYLDIAQRELARLTLMTDKILKTSVYEDKGIQIEYAPVHLDQLVDQVLSSMKLVFDKKGTVVTFVRSGTDFLMHGSHEHITNVLYNLFDNAMKYGGDEPRLDVSLIATAENLLLKVKDAGIGIPDEYKSKIFEKFFRVPSGDVHNIKGYGLGLSYVNSVVNAHGGEISVESEPSRGSCFTITLPRDKRA